MIYNDSFMDCLYGPVEELEPHEPTGISLAQWEQENAEKNHIGLQALFWEQEQAKRKRKSGAHNFKKKKKTVLQRSNWSCHYCGVVDGTNGVKLNLDHVIPKSKGGGNGNKNLVACCPTCNQAKADTSLEDFLNRRPDLKKLCRSLNYVNGMEGRAPWSGNPYSDLYNVEDFWDIYFNGRDMCFTWYWLLPE